MPVQKGGNNNIQMNRNNPIEEVIREINKANTLKDAFIPEKYALPGGWADKVASNIGRGKDAGMNSNQLRKVFTQLKAIEEKVNRNSDDKLTREQMNEILLLMPQVAYAHGRSLISTHFYNLLKECITPKKIKDREDYRSFVKFYTAVVAYSKMYNK
ncbi:MAG TPA: type III-A CRISPR-associated protein Csm2 [Tissierellia bacterium]|nr:type III-A CRISPR-associated protein Csm2 [Tissierellia bacterium]